MCHIYYTHHSGKGGVPEPGDDRCNVSDVEGLTSSVMAGLTTLDGLLCKAVYDAEVNRGSWFAMVSVPYDVCRSTSSGPTRAETAVGGVTVIGDDLYSCIAYRL